MHFWDCFYPSSSFIIIPRAILNTRARWRDKKKRHFIDNWIIPRLCCTHGSVYTQAKWWYLPSKRKVVIDVCICCTEAMYDEGDVLASSVASAAGHHRRSLDSPGCSLNYLLSFQHLQNCIARFVRCTTRFGGISCIWELSSL